MKHFHIETQDFAWASAFAYAFRDALTKKKAVNEPFQVSFSRTSPLVARLADEFNERPADDSSVTVITTDFTEEDLVQIDQLWAEKLDIELQELHGLSLGREPQRMPLPNLVQAMLALKYGILCEAGYWFPKVESVEGLRDQDAVCPMELVPYAAAFLAGYGVTNPKILVMDGLTELDRVRAVLQPGLKIAVLRPGDVAQVAARATYQGFDQIMSSVSVLCVIPDDEVEDERHNRASVAWPSQMTMVDSGGAEGSFNRGQSWRVRTDIGFDYHDLVRRDAEKRRNEAK